MSAKVRYTEYDDNGEEVQCEIDGIELELNKVYSQSESTWNEQHYKIIFVDDKIAIGKTIYNQISQRFIGEYTIFNRNNGTKYQDFRLGYRLKKEVK